MRRSNRGGSVGRLIMPGMPVVEERSVRCNHCQAHIFIPMMAPPSAWPSNCSHCHEPVCPRCEKALADGGFCVPFMAKLAYIEQPPGSVPLRELVTRAERAVKNL